MLAERRYNQIKQKLLYSKDNSINFDSKQRKKEKKLLYLFKSNSSLSRSIRSIASTSISNSVKSSASIIINNLPKNIITPQSRNPNLSINFNNVKEEEEKTTDVVQDYKSIKSIIPKNQIDIKIRNLVHDYTNISMNDSSYKVFSNIRSIKRMKNLNSIDEFEIWKTQRIKKIENDVQNLVNDLKTFLENTKNKIYEKFSVGNNILIEMVEQDVDKVGVLMQSIFIDRERRINLIEKRIEDMFCICLNQVNLKIVHLEKNLDSIGFLLEEQIKDLCYNKQIYIDKYHETKLKYYSKIIKEIKDMEIEVNIVLKKDYENFRIKWKNINLNHYLDELNKILNSKEFTDNKERNDIINELKKAQEEIYNKRKNLIFEKLFNLEYEKINTKNIQKLIKILDNIEIDEEKIYTKIIKKLLKNSDDIYNKSLFVLEDCKKKISTLNYDFTKDNHNDKKYNDFDDIKNIDELVDNKINPILIQLKEQRIQFISELNKYISEYGGYIVAVCEKVLNIFLTVGNLYDEYKKSILYSDHNYLILYAKECDDDENFLDNKNAEIKNVIKEMKNSINKDELDKGLNDCFALMDSLEDEYREHFNKVEDLLNSHNDLILDEFHNYEIKIYKLFGIYELSELYFIEKRRSKESIFFSKKKEADTGRSWSD